MTWELVIAILALLLALAAVWGFFFNYRNIQELRREQRRTRASAGLLAKEPDVVNPGPAYVIYNPTKSADWDYMKKTLAAAASDASMPEPVWLETTAEDTGHGQTRQALEAGASVVIAAGGDGTVRAVAEELTGTDTPLGLFPVGTGNLLARNLDLPLDETRTMAIIALTGKARPIDVGFLKVSPYTGDIAELKDSELADEAEHAFVVNAGMGFDAAIMAEADENKELKARVGWLAYIKAAMPHLLAKKMKVTISTGKEGSVTTDARSVMFLNCGELIGGVVIDSGAKFDDGWLELAVLDTHGGLIGWADLVRRLGLKGLGVKRVDLPGMVKTGDFDVHRIAECTIRTEEPHLIQVDGDVLGYTDQISARVESNALLVRVRN